MPRYVSSSIRRIWFLARSGILDQRLLLRVDALVFRFLGRLPEKHVGADGRAEDGDDGEKIVRVELDRRQERADRHGAPGNIDGERGRDIGQQRQRRPFQNLDIAFVAGKNLQAPRTAPPAPRHNRRGSTPPITRSSASPMAPRSAPRLMMLAISSSTTIAPQQRHRIVAAQIGGDAETGDAADAGADLLNRGHQGIGEHHRPADGIAELRADLRIGGDAAGIVVGGAGDQSRAELGPKAEFHGGCRRGRGMGY